MMSINSIPVEDKVFPDGTPNLLNIPIPHTDKITFTWRYNPKETISFVLIAKYLRAIASELVLEIPYFPNARMDRTYSEHEVPTLYYFAQMINEIGANIVKVVDPHSQKTLEYLDNIDKDYCYRPVYECFKAIIAKFSREFGEYPLIVFPDKGAAAKYLQVFKNEGIRYMYAEKVRNWEDGRIEGLRLVKGNVASPEREHALIIDDIVSYGGTILRCAQALKDNGALSVFAYTTHCEDSLYKGHLLEKDSPLDRFFTTNSLDINIPNASYSKPVKIYNVF